MRSAHLAAGAGGMYCGSCMHDNRLAATLISQGHDVVLIPVYMPLRTDETDVSQRRVFYGGVNAYLQQTSALFRRTPWFIDRLFDAPPLLRAMGRFASSTRPEDLGPMTLSVLRGEHGAQRKELEKLVAGLRRLGPNVVYLPNLMFVGVARRLKDALGVAVLCGLAGEDVFLDRLPDPYRSDVFALIRRRAGDVDGFVALTDYYAKHAAAHFALPPERVHRITMGIRVADFANAAAGPVAAGLRTGRVAAGLRTGRVAAGPRTGPVAAGLRTGRQAPPDKPFTIGYLARICPDKGLLPLCQAFARLRHAGQNCRLRVAGHLGNADRPYFARVRAHLRESGLPAGAFEYVGEVTREEKIRFLRSLDVLCMPTTYPESKGFCVLEALAAGVPVVLPNHGSFPELIEATGGGLLHEAGDTQSLADKLAGLMSAAVLRRRLAARGRQAVQAAFTADQMAAQAWRLFQQLASR